MVVRSQAIENERRAEERNEQPELPPFPEIRPVVTIATTLIIRDYCTQATSLPSCWLPFLSLRQAMACRAILRLFSLGFLPVSPP